MRHQPKRRATAAASPFLEFEARQQRFFHKKPSIAQKGKTLETFLQLPEGNAPNGIALDDTRRHIFASHYAQPKTFGRIEIGTKKLASIAWSPDGSRIATASADLALGLWDAKTGERALAIFGKEIVCNLVFCRAARCFLAMA